MELSILPETVIKAVFCDLGEKMEEKTGPTKDGMTGTTKPPHKPLYIVAVVAPCITFILMAFFNAMASGPGISLGKHLCNNVASPNLKEDKF